MPQMSFSGKCLLMEEKKKKNPHLPLDAKYILNRKWKGNMSWDFHLISIFQSPIFAVKTVMENW